MLVAIKECRFACTAIAFHFPSTASASSDDDSMQHSFATFRIFKQVFRARTGHRILTWSSYGASILRQPHTQKPDTAFLRWRNQLLAARFTILAAPMSAMICTCCDCRYRYEGFNLAFAKRIKNQRGHHNQCYQTYTATVGISMYCDKCIIGELKKYKLCKYILHKIPRTQ